MFELISDDVKEGNIICAFNKGCEISRFVHAWLQHKMDYIHQKNIMIIKIMKFIKTMYVILLQSLIYLLSVSFNTLHQKLIIMI